MKEDITIVSKSLPSKYVTFSSIQQYCFKYSIALFGSLLFRVKTFNRITEECETMKMNLRALLPPESDSFWSQPSSSLSSWSVIRTRMLSSSGFSSSLESWLLSFDSKLYVGVFSSLFPFTSRKWVVLLKMSCWRTVYFPAGQALPLLLELWHSLWKQRSISHRPRVEHFKCFSFQIYIYLGCSFPVCLFQWSTTSFSTC